MNKLFASLLSACAIVGIAQAQIFVTPGGSTDSAGDTVDAKAIFTVNAGAGTVSINLFNLLTAAQIKSVGQNLSNISFTLSGSGFTGAAISNTSPFMDQLINVGGGGAVTLVGTTNQLGWGLLGGGSTYTVEDLGFAGPANTLIGGTAGSTTPYSNAGGSIAGNGPHQPFIQERADWVININGLTANTVVTEATFSFGTTLGDNVRGTTPEPGTMGLLAVSVLAAMRRRVRR